MSKFSVSDIANFTDGQKSRELSPVVNITWVHPADIDGVNYVTGSEGKAKTIVEYKDVAGTLVLTTTTLKYEDATYPTNVTKVTVV